MRAGKRAAADMKMRKQVWLKACKSRCFSAKIGRVPTSLALGLLESECPEIAMLFLAVALAGTHSPVGLSLPLVESILGDNAKKVLVQFGKAGGPTLASTTADVLTTIQIMVAIVYLLATLATLPSTKGGYHDRVVGALAAAEKATASAMRAMQLNLLRKLWKYRSDEEVVREVKRTHKPGSRKRGRMVAVSGEVGGPRHFTVMEQLARVELATQDASAYILSAQHSIPMALKLADWMAGEANSPGPTAIDLDAPGVGPAVERFKILTKTGAAADSVPKFLPFKSVEVSAGVLGVVDEYLRVRGRHPMFPEK